MGMKACVKGLFIRVRRGEFWKSWGMGWGILMATRAFQVAFVFYDKGIQRKAALPYQATAEVAE
jgi:hypothetical protein